MAMLRTPSSRRPPRLLTGAGAGIVAGIVTGQVERALDRVISREQKRRERAVREASPHQLAGPVAAAKILGRRPRGGEETVAQGAFGLLYGIGWGLAYTVLRSRFPILARGAGLPFAIPFFLVCDGLIAPLLRLSPPLRRVPWQPNAKELANHVAWTATVELIERGAERVRRNRSRRMNADERRRTPSHPSGDEPDASPPRPT